MNKYVAINLELALTAIPTINARAVSLTLALLLRVF